MFDEMLRERFKLHELNELEANKERTKNGRTYQIAYLWQFNATVDSIYVNPLWEVGNNKADKNRQQK